MALTEALAATVLSTGDTGRGLLDGILVGFDALSGLVESLLMATGIVPADVAEGISPLVALVAILLVVAAVVLALRMVVRRVRLAYAAAERGREVAATGMPSMEPVGRRHPSFVPRDAEDLYLRFCDDAHGFEEWCAALARICGYRAEVTPASNDGGLDVRMWLGEAKVIAECKCYCPHDMEQAKRDAVGRPLLQKLVGANAVERADGLVFMTTSSYTAPAVRYAEEQNILLLDGNDLVDMAAGSPRRTAR